MYKPWGGACPYPLLFSHDNACWDLFTSVIRIHLSLDFRNENGDTLLHEHELNGRSSRMIGMKSTVSFISPRTELKKKRHIPFAGWHINWGETYYTPPLLWLLAFCFISSFILFYFSFAFMNFHSPTPISIFSFNASCWNSPMAIFLSCFVDLGVEERIRVEVGIVFRWGYFVSLRRNQVRCRVTVSGLWALQLQISCFDNTA